MKFLKIFKSLGPGLLYAAAAIGVSHLVQSTRAGAMFGTQLIWAVILANVFKYPFFQIGPRYSAITGDSLLVGYKKQGKWALWVFIVLTFLTMFTIQAAVTIVTAGLAKQMFFPNSDAKIISAALILICSIILIIGRYHILDKIIKFIIILLTITTIASLIGASSTYNPSIITPKIFSWDNKSHIFFIVALIGWMPAPLDISVWHSIWTLDQERDENTKTNIKAAILDFNIGYIGTTILAMAFLGLGALIMYGKGIELSTSAGGFAGQLINMYTESLGSWAYPLIAAAAFTTMFSTTLTCLDAFPRTLRETTRLLFDTPNDKLSKLYNFWLIITGVGAVTILFLFLQNMKAMVDFATTLSFVVAPIYALLNYLVIFSNDIPEEHRPSDKFKYYSWVGFIFLTGFCGFYLFHKYFN